MALADLGLRERADLQRLLRADIGVLDDDLLVIAEEFGEWEDAKRRIDLLALDKTATAIGDVIGPRFRSIEGEHKDPVPAFLKPTVYGRKFAPEWWYTDARPWPVPTVLRNSAECGPARAGYKSSTNSASVSERIGDSLRGGDRGRVPASLDLAEVLGVHAGDAVRDLLKRLAALAARSANTWRL